jgi:hypothetical protein
VKGELTVIKIIMKITPFVLVAVITSQVNGMGRQKDDNQLAQDSITEEQSPATTMEELNRSVESGTVTSVEANGENLQIKIQNDMGENKEFSASTDVMTTDSEGNSVDPTLIEEGTRVSLYVENEMVTKIQIESAS